MGCNTAFERAKDTAAFEVLWRQLKYPWMTLSDWRLRQFGVITSLLRCTRSLSLKKKPRRHVAFRDGQQPPGYFLR